MSNKPLAGMSLFEAVDFAADLLRACNCGYDESDDVIVFRKLQKDTLPGLTDEQVRTLFLEWAEHYYAKCVLARKDAIDAIMRFAEQHAKENPSPTPFR